MKIEGGCCVKKKKSLTVGEREGSCHIAKSESEKTDEVNKSKNESGNGTEGSGSDNSNSPEASQLDW